MYKRQVHGIFVEKPVLDIDLLKEIHAATDVPLVMHGTSGVDEGQVKEAIKNGVKKFNFYTGMGTAPTRPLAEKALASDRPVYFHEIAKEATDIMREKAKHVLEIAMNKG